GVVRSRRVGRGSGGAAGAARARGAGDRGPQPGVLAAVVPDPDAAGGAGDSGRGRGGLDGGDARASRGAAAGGGRGEAGGGVAGAVRGDRRRGAALRAGPGELSGGRGLPGDRRPLHAGGRHEPGEADMSEYDWVDRELYPFRPHHLDTPDGRMHYVDEGTGPVVLLVHGTPTWSFLYRDVIRAVAGPPRRRAGPPGLRAFGQVGGCAVPAGGPRGAAGAADRAAGPGGHHARGGGLRRADRALVRD